MSRPEPRDTQPPAPEPLASQPETPGPDTHGAISDLSRENTIYRRTMAVCDELADAALGGAEPVELTEVFARLVGKRVVLLDIAFRLRAQAGAGGAAQGLRWNRTDPSVDRLLRALEAARRPLRIPAIPGSLLDQACLVAPIVVRETSLGYLLVLDEPGSGYDPQSDDAEFLTVTYAATLFALTLAHEQTSAELDLRYRSSVVDALLSGHFLDARDARQKARSLGLPDDVPLRVAMLRPAPPDAAATARAPGPGGWAQRISALIPGAAAALRDGAVVAILPGQPDFEALTALCWLSSGGPPATCGVSEQLNSPELAPQGMRQAGRAIDLGVRLGRAGRPVRYDELGIYRLLLTIGDMRELMGFARDVLGPLLDYDTEHRTDLVRTLSVYLQHHGSHTQSARVLHLHTNTVAYRTQRIESITRLNLSDPDDRLVAHVAVKIIESQGTTSTGSG